MRSFSLLIVIHKYLIIILLNKYRHRLGKYNSAVILIINISLLLLVKKKHFPTYTKTAEEATSGQEENFG